MRILFALLLCLSLAGCLTTAHRDLPVTRPDLGADCPRPDTPPVRPPEVPAPPLAQGDLLTPRQQRLAAESGKFVGRVFLDVVGNALADALGDGIARLFHIRQSGGTVTPPDPPPA